MGVSYDLEIEAKAVKIFIRTINRRICGLLFRMIEGFIIYELFE